MDLCMSEEGGGGGGGGLNNFSQQPIFASTLLGAIPAGTHLRLDWKAPWQPPGVRGRGERLLLSANEVGTWGSVSLRLCLSASPLRRRRQRGGGGAAAMNACQVTRMPSSLISTPGLQAALFKCEGWEGLLALGSAL